MYVVLQLLLTLTVVASTIGMFVCLHFGVRAMIRSDAHAMRFAEEVMPHVDRVAEGLPASYEHPEAHLRSHISDTWKARWWFAGAFACVGCAALCIGSFIVLHMQ